VGGPARLIVYSYLLLGKKAKKKKRKNRQPKKIKKNSGRRKHLLYSI
jgi:hypothetical protein